MSDHDQVMNYMSTYVHDHCNIICPKEQYQFMLDHADWIFRHGNHHETSFHGVDDPIATMFWRLPLIKTHLGQLRLHKFNILKFKLALETLGCMIFSELTPEMIEAHDYNKASALQCAGYVEKWVIKMEKGEPLFWVFAVKAHHATNPHHIHHFWAKQYHLSGVASHGYGVVGMTHIKEAILDGLSRHSERRPGASLISLFNIRELQEWVSEAFALDIVNPAHEDPVRIAEGIIASVFAFLSHPDRSSLTFDRY